MGRINISRSLVAIAVALSFLPSVVTAQSGISALLEEVTVTARKREERLQDAPLAVSAFSGEALEFRGVTSIEVLDQFTPNLVLSTSPSFSNVSSNAAVYIRLGPGFALLRLALALARRE